MVKKSEFGIGDIRLYAEKRYKDEVPLEMLYTDVHPYTIHRIVDYVFDAIEEMSHDGDIRIHNFGRFKTDKIKRQLKEGSSQAKEKEMLRFKFLPSISLKKRINERYRDTISKNK